MDITKADIEKLDERVDGIKRSIDPDNLRKALGDRPLMLEFFGTPKAGKTTMTGLLKHSLKRLGLSVSTPTEGAEVVEWVKRVEPHYNFQTVDYALSVARERAYGPGHRDFHVVLFDRAIFDGVMRADHYAHVGTITERERATWEQYMLLPYNKGLFDFHVCMVCDADEAIQRELAKAIVRRDGETMNVKTLTDLRAAHDRIWARLRCNSDPTMHWHDSTGETPVETGWTVLQSCLDALTRAAASRTGGHR